MTAANSALNKEPAKKVLRRKSTARRSVRKPIDIDEDQPPQLSTTNDNSELFYQVYQQFEHKLTKTKQVLIKIT